MPAATAPGASHRSGAAQLSRAKVVKLIRSTFRDDPRRAVCIARRESNLRPRAYYIGNIGLFQINWSSHRHFSRARLYEVRYNVAAARRIYLDAKRRWGNGWLPWSTRHLC